MIVNQIKQLARDPGFLRRTAAIAIPIALQALLNNVLNFVDTLMIGTLGEQEIAAVGLANKVFFVFSLLIFGICSGSGVLASQYWGKREISGIRRVQGLSLLLAFGASVLFLLPSLLVPEFVMSIFTNSPQTIEIGAKYLRLAALSYPLTAISNVYTAGLRSVNQVQIPVVISLVSIVVNVFANYVLIFGHFGLPALGVEGAALGTLIARVVECAAMLLIVYARRGPIAAGIKEMLAFGKGFGKQYFRVVTPVILNEFMWGLGVTLYSLVYGRMSDQAVAAITVAQNIEQILQVVFMGLSNAAAIILGNEMGAGHLKDAKRHAGNFIFLSFVLSAVIMLLGALVRYPVIGLFNVSADVADSINLCLLIFIGYLPFKVFNLINIVGILRSGGDTKAALFLDGTGVWGIGLPMAVLGGMIWKQPIHIVYAMVLSEEFYKCILGTIRYKKGRWVRNLVAGDLG
ncbi:MAG: MATE family efflux transporter [Lachnospiraceae bacterium]|nr:MATE family efflux transporter [Lachnospiraceae bacterium]